MTEGWDHERMMNTSFLDREKKRKSDKMAIKVEYNDKERIVVMVIYRGSDTSTYTYRNVTDFESDNDLRVSFRGCGISKVPINVFVNADILLKV